MLNRVFMASVTLAFIAAYFMRHLPEVYSWPVAALIVVLSVWLFGRKRKPTPVGEGPVIPGTRRWARVLFHNGMLSLDELNKFYESHPEDEDFGE